MKKLTGLSVVAALVLGVGAAQAATVQPAGGTPLQGTIALSPTTSHSPGNPLEVDGFVFNPVNLTNGSGGETNCKLLGNQCLQFSSGNETIMTPAQPGATFSLNALSFVLAGQGAVLSVLDLTIDQAGSLVVAAQTSPNGQASCPASAVCVTQNSWYNLFLDGAADDVTGIRFTNTGTANLRIGAIDATLTPAPVPLPASALLLMGGVGGLSLLRRRRRAA